MGVGVSQGSVASFVAIFHTWYAAIKTPENISGLENYFIMHYAHWKWNMWNTYIWTTDERMNKWEAIAVMYAT